MYNLDYTEYRHLSYRKRKFATKKANKGLYTPKFTVSYG